MEDSIRLTNTKNEFLNHQCIILGNGFDLDMELPTSYNDFLESQEWKALSSNKNSNGLIAHIESIYTIENWCDLEETILKYAMKYNEKNISSDIIFDEYNKISNSLSAYLKRIAQEKPPRENSFAGLFLKKYLRKLEKGPIYTFNYTPLDFYARSIGSNNYLQPTYIHGNLEESSLILGIECENFSDIPQDLSFLIKSNSQNYHSIDLQEHLTTSKNVFIFGHSLNYIDKEYFRNFLLTCTKEKSNRNLYFITKNDKSDMLIRDNIRRMGISVIMLFLCCNVKFIHTGDIEQDKRDSVIEEILGY